MAFMFLIFSVVAADLDAVQRSRSQISAAAFDYNVYHELEEVIPIKIV